MASEPSPRAVIFDLGDTLLRQTAPSNPLAGTERLLKLAEPGCALTAVECGNDFTLNAGDMDEALYNALNRIYRRAIDRILSLPHEQRGGFKDRLEAIMESSSDIGWGYHDTLSDDYYRAFPEDE